MLSELANFQDVFGPLRLFTFISFRAVMGAATALILGLLIAPAIIKRLRAFKMEQIIRNTKDVGKLAELHAGKKGTPTMGGLIIYISVTVSALLWARWNAYTSAALLVYTGMTAVGFLDDYLKVSKRNTKGLVGRGKLFGQFLVTAGALAILLLDPATSESIRQLWLPFLKDPLLVEMPLVLLFALAFLTLAGSSNAINLTDGVDGLAIGCTLTVAMAYGLMAYATGNYKYADYLLLPFLPGAGELTVLCAILCAASLAFLWHNAHPAAVFMGDTGSLALGGLIGVIALMILQPFTLIIIGGVFVAEALSVIIQVGVFKASGPAKRRFFRMAPIHHHFEMGGWKETQVVIRFWILSLICAIAGLATLKLR